MTTLNETTNRKTKSSHSSHHSSHHSSYHSKSKHHISSSEMERKGENIIYDKVRKDRISQMFKRSIFVMVIIIICFVIIYVLTRPSDSYSGFKAFNGGITKEEVNELKNKIVEYEFYIEDLEERLSKYENVDSILD